MKKNFLIRLSIVFAITIFAWLIIAIKSNAASLSISTSKSTVSPGESFTVTVRLSNGAGYVSSGGQTQWLDNSSFSYTKTAGSSGSVTITASGTAADYTTELDQAVSASKTVQIVSSSSGGSSSSSGSKSSSSSSSKSSSSSSKTNTKTNSNNKTTEEDKEKSNDSLLTSLSISEGTISPEFNKDTTEYSVVVPYDVTEVNVSAELSNPKASIEIDGNKDLQEGENTVTITVTAEDGSKTDYIIKVTRKRIPIALKNLIIRYKNKNGELIELPLNPAFVFDNLEYTIENVEYWVEKLDIEAIANIEGAIIDIQGIDNLKPGENIITITLTVDAEDQSELEEGAEPKKETITYTIKVYKNEKPTLIGRISDWFKDLAGKISSWYNNHQGQTVLIALFVCIVALIGLSIYIIVDYNKYKDIISKAKKENKLNKDKKVKTEKNADMDEPNKIAEIAKKREIKEEKNDNDKSKSGKHF